MANDLEKYFNDMLILNPSNAFYLGFKNKNTLEHIENPFDCNYKIQLNDIVEKYLKTDNEILQYIIKNLKICRKCNFGYTPIYSFGNFILNFEHVNKTLYPKNNIQYELRKKDFDNIIESCIYNMRKGIKKNITLPRIICKKVIKQLENTKYKKLYDFIKNEYYPHTRKTIGLCDIKNGKLMYQMLIKSYCGFYISPKKIHNYGKELVKKFKKDLKYEPYSSKEELLADCEKYYDYITTKLLPKYFYHIPNFKCKIKPVPKNLEDSN